jgi:Ca-activated chloride channel family protein
LVLLLALATFATAQSTDVHIVPRTGTPADSRLAQPMEQESAPGDAPAVHTKPLRVDVNLVMVPVTVTDAKNHPVLGLDKQEFNVFEDGEPQQIRYFSSEDAPMSVGVVLDLSGSMKNKVGMAREAVADFFNAANPADDFFVVTFADKPELLSDFTQSVGSIQEKLATREPAGRTALIDAVYMAVAKVRQGRYKRRALLIISDGGDNRSRYNASEIKRMVQEADVEIYGVGIFSRFLTTPEEWSGRRLLQQITEATGGRTISVDNAAQLPETTAAISQELRSQYLLGYEPREKRSDGKLRRIRVRLRDAIQSAGMAVYSKRSYVAGAE